MGGPGHTTFRLAILAAVGIGLGLMLPAWPGAPLRAAEPPVVAGHALGSSSIALVGGLGSYRPALPSAGAPLFDWGMAYIIYGPGDDTTHFMGEGATTVVDNHLWNITTFGGEGSGGLSDYTVNYNVSTGEFNVLTMVPGPSARTNQSFADVPGQDFAVLFGGLTNLATQQAANDTWVYYFANQSWVNVTHGAAPPPRESAAFAVNATGDSALLEGGWDPHYVVNGSTATVLWNDTWRLNLTTFDWSQLRPASSPPPLYGSSMIWQNATDRFDLFGGCALGCSAGLWTFGGTPANWHLSSGGTPSGRGGSTWAWDAANDLGILYGGFDWGANGVTALGDGYVYSPTAQTWTALVSGGGPGPRFDAPSAWADFPGCVGLNLVGGNDVLTGPPMNASVLEPLSAPQPNCFPDLISGGGPPPPPCSVGQSPFQLRVVDNFTGAGVPNATVQLHGGCVDRTATTDSLGYLNLSIPAPDDLSVAASAAGYRPNEISVPFLPNATVTIILPLGPEPSLHVRTWGIGASGARVPLPDVTVAQGSTLVLGTSNAEGYLNVSHVYAPSGFVTIVGSRANFSSTSQTLHLPYAGPTSANLTLSVAGDLDVRITSPDGVPFLATSGTMRYDEAGAGPPVQFLTDGFGWFNFSAMAAGNYTLSSSAPGFFENSTEVYHGWVNATVVNLVLPPQVGATLDALVERSMDHLPLGSARVTVVGFSPIDTDASGWANFTGIRPAGLYQVVASAAGYISNYSWVKLAYGQVVAPYLITLRPIFLCPGSPGCPTPATSSGLPPFGYLNGGLFSSVLIIVAPAALLGGGLLYAAFAVRRDRTRAPESSPKGGRGR